MNYQEATKAFAKARNNAKLLPHRSIKKATSLISLKTSLEVAALSALLVCLFFFAYTLVTQGKGINFITHTKTSIDFLKGALMESMRYAVLTLALVFPLPTVGSTLIPKYREEAKNRLLNPRYFLMHGCIAAWIMLFFAALIPLVISGLNGFFGIQAHGKTLAHLSDSMWLQLMALTWLGYEAMAILNWRDVRKTKALTHHARSDFKLWLATSTGVLANRQHGAGMLRNQPVVLDLEDAAKNILIFGGIGSGKTSCAINPLLLQLLDQHCGGLIFDIKGDFHLQVVRLAQALGKEDCLIRLGMGGIPINLIEDALPEMATSFLKSAFLSDARSQGASAFWTDQATNLCTAVLGLLMHLPPRYNLKDMYDYIFNPEAKALITSELEIIKLALSDQDMSLFTHYQDSIEREFESFNEKTRNDIRATVTQVLMPFRNPRMTDAFCKPSHLNLKSVFDGSIYLLNLPLGVHGIAARVAYTFIKLRFFNLMQNRVSQPSWNQDNPVFFMCDEYQDIVTGNTGGLSDLNFWDKSRSSKTIGIVASQSISSFQAAIGDSPISDAVLQNFRQKICFSTEDQSTVNYFKQMMGTVPVKKHTISQQWGSSSGNHSNSHHSKTETISYTHEEVVDAQLMRNLKPQQAIAILTLQGHCCDDVVDLQAVH